jgi:hypothetical protein
MLPEAPAGKRPQKWAGAANLVGRFSSGGAGGLWPEDTIRRLASPAVPTVTTFSRQRTNRQRPNGAGLLFVGDCDSAAAGLKWPAMSTKSREVIWGGRIMGADIAPKAPDGAEAEAWSVRMEGYGGLGWLEVECNRCRTRAEPAARCHPPATGHADLEAGSIAQVPVRMIKLTEAREITPYKWVRPDEDR